MVELRKILQLAIENDDDIIVVCKDDHQFTEHYSKDRLVRNIIEAYYNRLEILLGGIGGFDIGIPASGERFWINSFYSTQFFILYRNIFKKILDFEFNETMDASSALGVITNYKMVLFPFISAQKEFGYSDITKWNCGSGAVEHLFISASERLELARRVWHFYHSEYIKDLVWDRSINELLQGIREREEQFKNASFVHFREIAPTRKTSASPEHFINVLIPFYNTEVFIQDCYYSLIRQNYSNFHLYFLNDASSDNTTELIPKHKRVSLLNNAERLYTLCNIYFFLKSAHFNDDDIIAIVDGDDLLLNNEALSEINNAYVLNDCLLSYGQYCFLNGTIGHCYPYDEQDFKVLRSLDWRASHLKTFKFKVFKELMKQDPDASSFKDCKGSFYTTACDVALMTPLLEIAGFRKVFFNKSVIYGYRIHPHNAAVIDRVKQYRAAKEILDKRPLKTVSFECSGRKLNM